MQMDEGILIDIPHQTSRLKLLFINYYEIFITWYHVCMSSCIFVIQFGDKRTRTSPAILLHMPY